ncbi:TVP38/TMEM64 family protein [Oxynema aestuarii AP17]|uniref:TVP38/TMEM64 family membrane protein n=2 Tax=Oxynema TaxID=1492710 RepID=A0A6H1U663_9CYAN|nr:TVP38/TMEM64 family protein [Oxynema aestuarii AP17]
MAIYILATVLFIPGSILTLGAGVIFGIGLGSLYVFVAATVGAIVAFLIGRYLARSWVESQIKGNQKFKAVDDAVAREGLKIVVLTRLSPFFPFNLLNYAFGVTRVSLRDYAIGCLGMLPGTIMYVYIGSLARLATIGTDAQNSTGAETAFKIVGAIVTIFGTIYVTRVASKALNSEISGD